MRQNLFSASELRKKIRKVHSTLEDYVVSIVVQEHLVAFLFVTVRIIVACLLLIKAGFKVVSTPPQKKCVYQDD